MMAGYTASRSVPKAIAPAVVLGSGLLIIAGSLMVLLGFDQAGQLAFDALQRLGGTRVHALLQEQPCT